MATTGCSFNRGLILNGISHMEKVNFCYLSVGVVPCCSAYLRWLGESKFLRRKFYERVKVV